MGPLVRRRASEQGSVTVQSLFMIAILVLILALSFEVWKAVTVKRSLQAATYQAAKYIALNGLEWGLRPDVWARRIGPLIEAELDNNPFIPAGGAHPYVSIWLNPEANALNYCERGQFTLRVELGHDVFMPPSLGQAPGGPLHLQLVQTLRGQLECYP